MQNEADIPYTVVRAPGRDLTVNLTNSRSGAVVFERKYAHGDSVVDAVEKGSIEGVPAGMYDLRIANEAGDAYAIKVGVGDLFLVAGQSNAASAAQDHELDEWPESGMFLILDYTGCRIKSGMTADARPT